MSHSFKKCVSEAVNVKSLICTGYIINRASLWLSGYTICLQCGRPGFDPWVGKIPWRRERLSTPVFWPGEFYGLCRPWGGKESDMTEWLSLTHIINCLKWLLISPIFPSSSFFPLCPLPFHCSSLCHVFHSLLSSEDTIGNKTLSKTR